MSKKRKQGVSPQNPIGAAVSGISWAKALFHEKADRVTHFAVVMDHSTDAEPTVRLTRQTFPDLKEAWDKFDEGYQFLIFVKGKNGHDQGTMLARDLDSLLNQAIPGVLQKVASVGGTTGFFLAVDTTLLDRLEPSVNGHFPSTARH